MDSRKKNASLKKCISTKTDGARQNSVNLSLKRTLKNKKKIVRTAST